MSVLGQEITILGAGISGLALARALAMQGAVVTVLEQAAAISEVGAGIQISPNGVAVLSALGLLDPALAAGARARGTDLCDQNGRLVINVDFEKYAHAFPYLCFHRADLIEILANGAREVGVDIRLGQTVTAVDAAPDETRLTMADGGTSLHRAVVGADGIKSVVRAAIGETEEATFTGNVAWRATVPMAVAPDVMTTIYMGTRRHIVTYPLRGGTMMNLVMIEETDDWTAEGWSETGDVNTMRRVFGDFPAASDLLSRVETVHRWGLFKHDIPTTWGKNGAVLIGDAAHPTLPFMAQGANLALEDAWVLARAFAQTDRPSHAAALYQSIRQDRVGRVIEAAGGNGGLFHIENPVQRKITHTGMRILNKIAPQRISGRYDWIYGYDVTTVI